MQLRQAAAAAVYTRKRKQEQLQQLQQQKRKKMEAPGYRPGVSRWVSLERERNTEKIDAAAKRERQMVLNSAEEQ